MAAIPPPAGIQSNFTNPPTAGGGLQIFTAAGLIIAGLFLIMRLYTKTILLRKFGWEDGIVSSISDGGVDADLNQLRLCSPLCVFLGAKSDVCFR